MKRAIVLLFFAATLDAATFIVPDDRTLAVASRAIVVAAAEESHARWSPGGWIETVTRFAVMETIKGDAAESLDVVELGGIAGTTGLAVAGSPRYAAGQRYLLFLDRNDRGEWTAKNMIVGVFAFSGDQLLRLEPVCGWDVEGRPHREPRRSAAAFLEYVRAVVRGEDRAAGYFVDTPMRTARTDASLGSYLLQTSGASGTLGIRWSQFPSAVVFLSRGTQPGATGGGITAVQRGIAAWTGEPSSNIVYQYGGATNATGGFRGADGVNSIVFNDAGNEIPGAYTGRTGDTLAIGGAWFSTTGTGATHTAGAERFYTIREADLIVQNGIFGAGLTGNGFDHVVTHELGHTLGLRHSDEPPSGGTSATNAIMNSTVNFNGDLLGASLQAWDREAVAAVYGSAPSCTPPSIAVQPVTVELRSEPATLSVTAAGPGTMQYQWFIGQKGNTSQPVGGATGPSISVRPASTTAYWVRVSNGCNPPADSEAAFVVVNNCPGVVIAQQEPLTTTIIEGRAATLTVTASGGVLSYQWYAGFSGDRSAPVAGATGPALEVRPPLTARYWVEVKNACGAFASGETMTIFVQPCDAPRIVVQPAGGVAASGDVVTLAAAIIGSEPMVMQWYEGVVGDKSRPLPNGRASSVSAGPLVAASSYWLYVENDCGSASSQAASFAIAAACAAPRIVQQPRDVVVPPGAEALLEVAATGTSLGYRWYEGPLLDFTRPAGPSAPTLYVAPSGAARTFWVRVANNCGQADSLAVTVTPGSARRRAAQ